MEGDGGRISVSRDALKAELLQLELRLIEKLATKDEVDNLALRIGALETQNSPTEQEFSSVRAWQLRMAGAMALVLVVISFGLPVIVQHYVG